MRQRHSRDGERRPYPECEERRENAADAETSNRRGGTRCDSERKEKSRIKAQITTVSPLAVRAQRAA